MKTDEQLGEIGGLKAYGYNVMHEDNKASRTAFAKAVREAIFAECCEVPSVEALMKRIQELEEALSKAAELSGKSLIIMGKLGMDASTTAEQVIERIDRIHALPEKWLNTKAFSEARAALIECANELAAALGEGEKPDTLMQTMAEVVDAVFPSPVDHYAELKAAHKAGKAIQIYLPHNDTWVDIYYPAFGAPLQNYRIKPFSLREHVAKSFPSLNDTHVFHRDDWKEGYLESGERPLLADEVIHHGDLGSCCREKGQDVTAWTLISFAIGELVDAGFAKTRRPLPLPPVFVPLESKDIPPGSVIRRKEGNGQWWMVNSVTSEGVWHPDVGNKVTFTYFKPSLENLFEISRDGGKTWESAKKLKEEQS